MTGEEGRCHARQIAQKASCMHILLSLGTVQACHLRPSMPAGVSACSNEVMMQGHEAYFWCVPRALLQVNCLKGAHLGRPACMASSASMREAPGSFSEGLSTKVLPAVQAMGNIQSGIMAGKLKGQMPAHTCKPIALSRFHTSSCGC